MVVVPFSLICARDHPHVLKILPLLVEAGTSRTRNVGRRQRIRYRAAAVGEDRHEQQQQRQPSEACELGREKLATTFSMDTYSVRQRRRLFVDRS